MASITDWGRRPHLFQPLLCIWLTEAQKSILIETYVRAGLMVAAMIHRWFQPLFGPPK